MSSCKIELRIKLECLVHEVGLRTSVPALDRFGVKIFKINRTIKKLADFHRIKRPHPNGQPQPRLVAKAAQSALDLEIKAHIRVRNRQPLEQRANSTVNWPRENGLVKSRPTERTEWIVAGEKFVPAIAAEGHGDMLAGEPVQQVGRKQRAIAERFVEPRQTFIQQGVGPIKRQLFHVMIRAE